MSRTGGQNLIAFVLASAGATAWFVLSTVAMDQVPDLVLLGVSLLIAAAIRLSLRSRGVSVVFTSFRREALLAAAGGVLAFWAAPLIVLAQRATDAPSGADVLFFSTVGWALLCAVGAFLVREGRPAARSLAAALVSVAGAAALLANWERPSSFSPFAKFPVQELWMLAAGVLFVAGGIAIAGATRRVGLTHSVTIALAAAGLVGALGATPFIVDSVPTVVRMSTGFILMGVAMAAFATGWTSLQSTLGIGRAGIPLMLAPVSVTALFALERATGVFGPSPFQLNGVLAGGAVCVAGAVALWLSEPSSLRVTASHSVLRRAGEGAAVLAVLVSAMSLALPALRATSEGIVPQEFSVTWLMVGAESAAGWLPMAAALLVCAAAWDSRKQWDIRGIGSALIAAALALAATPFLADTTLHTWNSWIPAMVQQTYGTEYARFGVEAVSHPVRILAVVLTGVAIAALAGASVLDRRSIRISEAEE